ncbi:MAG TPA: hypothetical protein P5232_03345 [Candidatus Moranbacteria bacterium]|nr:hypothetical protein [Candidatus Moranbacteria bacterium]
MQTSDWVLIGTTLFLGAMALLAPYLIEKWKYRFYSAKLNFKFFHKPPYCHQTEMRSGSIRFPVYYFRFKVVNDGKVQAEQCEAVLEKIWKENSAGELKKYNGFSPVSLKWSGIGGIKYLTIQPGREIFCDIGRIQHPNHESFSVYKGISEQDSRKNKFFFEFPDIFFSQWDCLVPGKYEIEVAVYSKNAKRISRRFKISWSGEWKDRESEMLNELTIS